MRDPTIPQRDFVYRVVFVLVVIAVLTDARLTGRF